MKKGEVKLIDLSFEFKLWKNRLKSYIKDTEIIKTRNQELTKSNKDKALNAVEVMVLEDHKSQLTDLLKLITIQEQEIQYYNKDFPLAASHEYITTHNKMRCKISQLCNIHTERINDLITALGI